MRNNNSNNLLGLFRSKARTLLLLNFFINPEKEYYIRQLEKNLKIPSSNVKRELGNIKSAGLITARPLGNLILYKVNQDHNIYNQFRDLILNTVGIQELIKPIFQKEKSVIVSFIYGSYAKGEFDSSSDIDVFVLVKSNDINAYQSINKKISKFEDDFGREINIDFQDLEEFQNRKKKNDPYILDLITNAKVFLKGGENDL